MLVGCWETGISLAGETLSSNSPCPELELRLQVAQRIQDCTQDPSGCLVYSLHVM